MTSEVQELKKREVFGSSGKRWVLNFLVIRFLGGFLPFLFIYFICLFFLFIYLFFKIFIVFFFKSVLVACPTHTNNPGSGLGTGGIVFDKHIDKSTQQMNLKVHSYIFFTMIGVFKDAVAGSNAQHIFFTMNPSPLLV